MRNATYELAMPSSPTTLSTARATASVVSSFALTAAATAIFTVARTTTIASPAIAVNASVTCSSMATTCSALAVRGRPGEGAAPPRTHMLHGTQIKKIDKNSWLEVPPPPLP